MRVIAGTARSLKLKTPDGQDTRPTTDRIKETLFNIIQMDIPGCIFIDLFAGSGGIGIEALSRGARHAYFAENAKEPVSCIQENLIFTKLADRATLLKQDVLTALSLIPEKEADIIFMDPPYELGIEKNVFSALAGQKYVTENTMIIVEAKLDKSFDFLDELGFELTREKKYKTNKHIFCRKVNENEKSNLSRKL